MKKILFALLAGFSVVFTSCFETTSETSINAKGGGTVSVVMDMSKMFDLLEQMGKDPSKEMKTETEKDSSFDFKDKIAEIEKDFGRPLTADEKAMLEKTTGRLQMNVKDKIMKISINSEFTKLSQLALFQEIQKKALNKPPMNDDNNEAAGVNEQQDKMTELASKPGKAMSFNVKDGLIENTYDEKKFELSDEEETLTQQMEQAKMMLGEMPMKLIYKLPRPARNITAGGKYELSEDKKTVTIRYDLLETFTNPGVQAYKIEY